MIKNAGIFTNIQVGSKFDFLNLSQTINFTILSQELFNSIAHE